MDVQVKKEGTIFLFTPTSDAGRAWIEEHLPENATWWGGGVVVEHRYAPDIAEGMLRDDLDVQ